MVSTKNETNTQDDLDLYEFSIIVEGVLQDKSQLLPLHLRDFDLSFGEKFLLLSHFGLPGEYLKNGVFTVSASKELKASDTFGEVSLLRPTEMDCTIIAIEDVHLVSFTRDDYRILYSLDIKSIQNKMQFLMKIFNETTTASLVKIAYFLEEKVFLGREVIYKEGDESKAIYFIKKGEVQLILQKHKLSKVVSLQEIRNKSSKKQSSKPKMIVGNLQAGAMFGEEDVIEKQNRKYTAISTHPQTVLYVLRSEVFSEIFDKHLPHIANVFKDWMKIRSIWRKQRTEAEQELSAGLEAASNKVSKDPYSLQDTDNKRQVSQEPPKKFYSPRKEIIEDFESSGIQERITFKVITNQPNSFLTQKTPQKQVETGFEHRLFEKQNASINASKDVQNLFKVKEKKTPRKEDHSSKHTLDSYTPSINELITPRSFENKVVKSRTLNNELVSARPKLSAKPKTLITLEHETCDTNSSKNGFSILTSIKSVNSLNIDNKIMSSPMISPLSTKTITKNMIIDSLKSTETPKLSKESFKLLKRITSNQTKDNTNGDNEQLTEYGMNIPDKYYTSQKSERIGRSKFKRQFSTKKLKEYSVDGKVEYYRPYLKLELDNIHKAQNGNFRIKKLSQTHLQVNKAKELDRSNPMSINNLELKL